jgi:phosphoglycerol transferase MdoB-like AlkP superfamily enzyme
MNQSFRDLLLLFLRLLAALVMYPLCKLFFFFLNHLHFADVSFLELIKILFFGLRFDLSSLVTINLVFILFHSLPFHFVQSKPYQFVLKIIFLLSNGIAILSDCMDMAYYPFTLKRTTYDFFHFMNLGTDFSTLLPRYLLDFWYIVLLWIVLLIMLSFLYDRTKMLSAVSQHTYHAQQKWNTWLMRLFSWAVLNTTVIGLCIIAFRGGLQLRPIMPINAAAYVNANYIPLSINTPFSIIKSYGLEELDEKIYFNEQDILHQFNPIHPASQTKSKPNIFILILESFSKEFTGLGNEKSYTPFLDSLMKESLVFTHAFANGKRSIDGIPAIVASMPTLMNESFITSGYCSNPFDALPTILKPMGYSSAFFHGGTNGTMGFDAFCKSAGFENYYGRFEYNHDSDYDGEWGIWDEPFLQYSVEKVSQLQEPFYASVFTLSSHHPYAIPKKYATLFKEGTLPIHKCIAYTDYSLKKFFESASKQKWFTNTLFVITADHTGASDHPYYTNSKGSYEIPILYYQAHSTLKGRNPVITQQLDIVPTLLSITGSNKNYFAFGKNAFDSTQAGMHVSFVNGVYQLIQKDYLLQFDGNTSIALFRHSSDSLLQTNLIHSIDEPTKSKLEGYIKAVIQTYSAGMIHNKLSAENFLTPTLAPKK